MSDLCLLTNLEGKEKIYLLMYVDDILIGSKDLDLLNSTKSIILKQFPGKDFGRVSEILGVRILYKNNQLALFQGKMINKLVEKFGLTDAKIAITPLVPGQYLMKEGKMLDKEFAMKYRELVGALLYLAMITRPDIAFSCSQLSQYLDSSTEGHWVSAKRVLRYLKETKGRALGFSKEEDPMLNAYSDADFAGSPDRRSITGIAIYHGKNLIDWRWKNSQ